MESLDDATRRHSRPRPAPSRSLLIHTYILLALLAWLLAQSATSLFFAQHPADAIFGLFCTPTFTLLGLAQILATFGRRPRAASAAAIMSFAIALPLVLLFVIAVASRSPTNFDILETLLIGGGAVYAVLIATLNLDWAAALRRPAPPGFCRHCGYDLRATPLRCPECGLPNARENP